MKRIIALALAAMMSVAVLAGCGGSADSKSESDSTASQASSVDLNTVLDKINSDNNLSLDKIDDVKKLKRYYSIEEADVKQFAGETDKSDPNAPIEEPEPLNEEQWAAFEDDYAARPEFYEALCMAAEKVIKENQ